MAGRNRRTGDGQAISLSNLQITRRFLDADYEIYRHDLTRGQTGLLEVFSIVTRAADKPNFRARLDDGSTGRRRDPELDIDIVGVTERIKRDFKASRNGYVGHRTDRSPNLQQRVFQVEITTPTGKVFEGDVSFNASFSVGVHITSSLSVSADSSVVRATRLQRLCRGLVRLWRRMTDRFFKSF
jgi:hypothetical protein